MPGFPRGLDRQTSLRRRFHVHICCTPLLWHQMFWPWILCGFGRLYPLSVPVNVSKKSILQQRCSYVTADLFIAVNAQMILINNTSLFYPLPNVTHPI